jgi:hypothetical protein
MLTEASMLIKVGLVAIPDPSLKEMRSFMWSRSITCRAMAMGRDFDFGKKHLFFYML